MTGSAITGRITPGSAGAQPQACQHPPDQLYPAEWTRSREEIQIKRQASERGCECHYNSNSPIEKRRNHRRYERKLPISAIVNRGPVSRPPLSSEAPAPQSHRADNWRAATTFVSQISPRDLLCVGGQPSSWRSSDVVRGRVSSARGHEAFDDFDGLDAAAGADGSAVERGGGAGKIELALQGPSLQEPVDEAGVKNISGASGVNRLHAKGGRVVEARPVQGQHTFFAECGSGKTAAK